MSIFPDLTAATATVERLMSDTCTVVRNPDGVTDAVLNQDTGALVDPAPTSTVYSGKCFMQPAGGGGVDEEGGAQFVARTYQLTIPMSAALPAKGDLVVITASARDASLVDQKFTVRDVLVASLAVARRVICEARQ